jgi:hypothetical protein
MLKTRFAPTVSQPFASDAAGSDYFVTDFHYMNVAAEIRRQLAQQRGFLVVNGPPSPDGKLLERYLDGSTAAESSDASGFRANLVRCREGWTFGDVVIAYSRQLGLSPDAGAWSILSQVMQESRKGIMRVLILDNADALDDNGFDELRRFTRVDDPYVLPVVLLAGPGFASRMEVELRTLRPAVVGSLSLQHLLPDEVAAFIRYQLEPMGDSYEGAFPPGAVMTIAEAAEGDPRVVNELARQHLDAFAGPQDADAPTRSRRDEDEEPEPVAPVAPVINVAAEPPVAAEEPLPVRVVARSLAPDPSLQTVTPLPRPVRRPVERLARNLVIAAILLFAGAYGIALLYSMLPESSSDGTARPVTASTSDKASATSAVPAPTQTADRRSADRPPSSEKPVVAFATPPEKPAQAPAKPAKAAASRVAPPLGAAAKKAASIEPSAPPPPPPQVAAPAVRPAPPPPQAAAPVAPPPAGAAPAARPARPQPQTIARAEAQPAQRSAAPADQAPTTEMSALTARGDQFLAAGDIESARDFFERAVEEGDAAASCGLGKTYDPLFLQQVGMRGVAGDPGKAATWYRRAVAAGNAEAATRLAKLLAKYPQDAAGEGSTQ